MLIACRVEAMDESGARGRSTAAKLPEKLKGEDVKKDETRVEPVVFRGITVLFYISNSVYRIVRLNGYMVNIGFFCGYSPQLPFINSSASKVSNA
ncbi:hypothetical protein YC2023_025961 [Brassica napus]